VAGWDAANGGRFAATSPRARELLELERNALRMFTSCGWFFDDIAGIEAVQILRYAARAIELAGADAPRLEGGLLERLARAESNAPGVGSGRQVYVERAKRRAPPAPRSSGAAAPAADLERELLGAVRSLAQDQSPTAITAVLELADRLHGDHRPIPFDVQTVFYRIRAAAPPERAGPLAPVARRLGFAEGGGT
jgi:Domain of unknown function (DUF3536)